jgi:hypothetical protein
MSFFRRNSPWIIGFVVLVIFGVLTWLVFAGFSQNATWVAIGLAALASLFAAVSAVASLVQAFEAQKQREMSERPYVMVYFDAAYGGFLSLVITNAGNAPAVDVRIKFDPGFQIYSGESINNISLFQNPISFLPPGMLHRQLIDASHRFLEKGKPTYFKAHLEYRTPIGRCHFEVLREIFPRGQVERFLTPKTPFGMTNSLQQILSGMRLLNSSFFEK